MNIYKEIDIDLKKCTDDQIKNVAKLTAYHSNVLLRNQELSKDEYARILALWGDKTKHHAWYEDPDHHQCGRDEVQGGRGEDEDQRGT